MSSLADLISWRDALERARFSGVRTLHEGDKTVTYGSDAEMVRGLADLDRRIADLQGAAPVRGIKITASKGLT